MAKKYVAIWISFILLGIACFPSSLAYWVDQMGEAVLSYSLELGRVGQWDDVEEEPTFSPPYGAIEIPSGGNHQFEPHEIVYYKGNLIRIEAYGITEQQLLSGSPVYGTSFLGWHWYPDQIYQTHQVVWYQGKLYRGADTVGNLVSPAYAPDKAAAWKPVGSIDWIAGKVYPREGTIVRYEGELYRLKWYAEGDTPPSQSANYEKIINPSYMTKTYRTGEVVTYQGGVYQAVDSYWASRQPPETVHGAWNRLDSSQWSPYQTYALHDAVEYQGHVYQVVDEYYANRVPPNEQTFAWNRIDTYYFEEWNTYGMYDPVVVDEILYVSLYEGNTQPISDSQSWQPITNLLDLSKYFPRTGWDVRKRITLGESTLPLGWSEEYS